MPVTDTTPMTLVAMLPKEHMDHGKKGDNKKAACKNQIDAKNKLSQVSKPNGDLKQFFRSFGELSQNLVMRIHSNARHQIDR